MYVVLIKKSCVSQKILWCSVVEKLKLMCINVIKTEAAGHSCSVTVLKNQKQPLADVLKNRCS